MGTAQSNRGVHSNSGPAQKYITNNGLTILCYKGDVTEADADGIVTSENCGMPKPSMVTEALLKKANIHYHHLRKCTNHKYGTIQLTSGEAYCLKTHYYGIQLHFKFILLAIVWPYEDAGYENTRWKSHTERLYRNILEKADYKGLTSLAVPLLGSGKAEAPRELAVDALITALSQYRPSHTLTTVHLVSLDEHVLNDILKQLVRNEPNGDQLMDNLMLENTNEQLCSFELIGHDDVQSKDHHTRTNTNEDVFRSVSNKQKDGQSNSNFTRGNINDEHLSGSVSMSSHEKQLHQQKHQYVDSRKEDDMFTAQSNNGHAHPKTSGLIKINEYVTHNGLNILCYKGDITEVDADGIVTSDNCGMPKPSMVTEALLKKANTDYDNLRKCTYDKYWTIKSGEAYSLQTDYCGIQSHFKFILLAIVWPYEDAGYNKTRWNSHTERLYRKILEKADYKGLKSLAVPLLGSGKAGAPREVAVHTLITALSRYRPRYNLTTVLIVSLNQQVLIEVSKQCDEPGLRAATHDTRYPVPNQDRYEYDGNVNQSEMGSNTGFNSDTEANHSAPRWESDYGYTNLTKEQTPQSALPNQEFNNRHDRTRHDTQLDQTQRLLPVLDTTDNQPTGMFNILVKEPATRRNTNKDAFGSVPNGDNDKEEHLSGPAYNEHNDGQSNENLFSENTNEQNVSGLASNALNNSQTEENLNTGKPAEEPVTESMSREGVLMNPECDHTSCTQSDKTVDDSKPHPSNIKSDVLIGDQPDGKMTHNVIADMENVTGIAAEQPITESDKTIENVTGIAAEQLITESDKTMENVTGIAAEQITESDKTMENVTGITAEQLITESDKTMDNVTGIAAEQLIMESDKTIENVTGIAAEQPVMESDKTMENVTGIAAEQPVTQSDKTIENVTGIAAEQLITESDKTMENVTGIAAAQPVTQSDKTMENVTGIAAEQLIMESDKTIENVTGIAAEQPVTESDKTMENVTGIAAEQHIMESDKTIENVTGIAAEQPVTESDKTMENVTGIAAEQLIMESDKTIENVTGIAAEQPVTESDKTMENVTGIAAEQLITESDKTMENATGIAAAQPITQSDKTIENVTGIAAEQPVTQSDKTMENVTGIAAEQLIMESDKTIENVTGIAAEQPITESDKTMENVTGIAAEQPVTQSDKTMENVTGIAAEQLITESDKTIENVTGIAAEQPVTESDKTMENVTGIAAEQLIMESDKTIENVTGIAAEQPVTESDKTMENVTGIAAEQLIMESDKTIENVTGIAAEQPVTESDKTMENVTGIAAEQPVTQSDKTIENVTGIAAEQPITESDKTMENVTGIAAEQPVTQSDKTIENVTGIAAEQLITESDKTMENVTGIAAEQLITESDKTMENVTGIAAEQLIMESDKTIENVTGIAAEQPVTESDKTMENVTGIAAEQLIMESDKTMENVTGIAAEQPVMESDKTMENVTGIAAEQPVMESDKTIENVTGIAAEQPVTQSDKTMENVTGIAAEQLVTESDKTIENVTGIAAEQPVTESDKTMENVTGIAAEQLIMESDKTIENITGIAAEQPVTQSDKTMENVTGITAEQLITQSDKTIENITGIAAEQPVTQSDKTMENVTGIAAKQPVTQSDKTIENVRGNQPDGKMTHKVIPDISIPGYEGHGIIVIDYYFADGIQTDEHPHPGKPYQGVRRRGFLPDNAEGQAVLLLLKKAFDCKLTFSITPSTADENDIVTWNIPHKTNTHGGPKRNGYPDETYLSRVREELARKGLEKDEHLSDSVSNEHDGQSDRIVTRENEKDEHLSGSVSNEHRGGQSKCNFPIEKTNEQERSGSASCARNNDETDGNLNSRISAEQPVTHSDKTIDNVTGNQPDGKMSHKVIADISIPGYEGHGVIVVDYYFEDGIQKDEHPHPEKPYQGVRRRGFLPNNAEGQAVLLLLKKAFDRKLTFSITPTADENDIVTWNISHKTNTHGGPKRDGYPDETYLSRVREELARKGLEKDEHLSDSVSNEHDGQSDRIVTRENEKDEHLSGSVSNEHRGGQSKCNFPIEKTNEQERSGSASCARNNDETDGNLNSRISAEQPVTHSDKTIDNVTGNQPDGKMSHKVIADISIPGYEGHGVIVVDYYFEDGIQKDEHPHPEKPYQGVRRRGFLPNNAEGQAVLLLLKKAFDRKLTFSITPSTADENDIVTWNISHKTNTHGGPKRDGYPDETYLSRVREELARKGLEKDEHLSDSVSNEHDGQSDRIVTRENEKDEHLSGSVSNEHRGGQSNGNFPIEKTNEQDVSGSASCARNNNQMDGNLNSGISAEQPVTQSDKTIDNVTGISAEQPVTQSDKTIDNVTGISAEQPVTKSDKTIDNVTGISAEQPVTQSDKTIDNVTGISAEQPVTQSDKTIDNVTGISAEQPVTKSDKTLDNVTGNQPDGKMTHKVIPDISIPGYEGHGVIIIDYYFEDGVQMDEHPHPGKPYQGVRRRGFLPDNAEGQAVLLLLKKAFDRKVTFSITPTADENDIVTWNIHHKTNTHGGPQRNGYPDKTYLSRVREELARKGVTE